MPPGVGLGRAADLVLGAILLATVLAGPVEQAELAAAAMPNA
jgi:hypothetical protein